MLNFTVGPVQMCDEVREIGSHQVPYFRTPEFSQVMLENEQMLLELACAPLQSRSVFVTGSGTAAMEAAVMNTLSPQDKVLVINGGSFGARFCELLDIHQIPHEVLFVEAGHIFHEQDLDPYTDQGFTAFVINMGETSTGVLYDMDLVSRFCREQGLFLIVDVISSFLADELDMDALGVDVLTIGSQKALACPPGISALVLSPRALSRIECSSPQTLYLNLSRALADATRGQTPFTPAVGTLLQMHARLKQIVETGGAKAQCDQVQSIAHDFRARITGLPVTLFAENPSSAVTSLETRGFSATKLFAIMKDTYDIWVCPNGGELAERVFRVGHIGCLTKRDNEVLVSALKRAIATCLSEV